MRPLALAIICRHFFYVTLPSRHVPLTGKLGLYVAPRGLQDECKAAFALTFG